MVVLAGKDGAWRPVADGEQFGPGHSFSINMATGARYVSVPFTEPVTFSNDMESQAVGSEALVADFVGRHPAGEVRAQPRL